MKRVALSEIKDHLSEYLRISENEDLITTRHGKVVGVLIGFQSEDDGFEYKLENDPRFLKRIERSRSSLSEGSGIRLEDITE